MHPAIQRLLDTQLRDGFPDIRGTDATLTIPFSDRLVNETIAAFLPANGKVREVTIASHDGNRFTARVRTGSIWIPPMSIELDIEKQPGLPDDPTLTLKLSHSSKFVALAASTLPALVKLPPGITVIGDRIRIDIRRLLAERGVDAWLAYVSELRIGTRQDAVLVYVRAAIR
jgi:hypothetical protein